MRRKKKVNLVRASVYLRADVLEGLKQASKAGGPAVSEFIRDAATRSFKRSRGRA
jgi:metal-responsive CopG/Arc/MetJ family transcriptional regulator